MDITQDPATKDEDFSVSEGQKGFFFLYQLDKKNSAYNITIAYKIHSEFEVNKIKNCFQILVNRHDIFRTNFFEKNGVPRQKIHTHADVNFKYIDSSHLNESELREKVSFDANEPFDLEHDPLYKIHIYKQNTAGHVLLIGMHHIVFDAFSYYIFMNEFLILYSGAELPSQKNSNYLDHVRSEEQWMNSEKSELSLAFWKSELQGDLPTLQLPALKRNAKNQSHSGALFLFELDSDLIKRLKAFAQTQQVTLYTVFLTAYQILLYRYTGQQDLIVGSPMSGRHSAEFAETLGYFVNTVPLRFSIDPEMDFQTHLHNVFRKTREAMKHQRYPFPCMVEKINVSRDTGVHPLFQTIFTFQKSRIPQISALISLFSANKRISFHGLELENYPLENKIAQFDLSLEIIEAECNLFGQFEFDKNVFDESFVQTISNNFVCLLESMLHGYQNKIANISALNSEEYFKITDLWNRTEKAYDEHKTIHGLFEEQVERTPNNCAVLYENASLTYQELNARANRLAHFIYSIQEIKPDTLILLCLDRSEHMLIATLAVLKSGAAYVPIDPLSPDDRIQYIFADTNAQIVLTNEVYRQRLEDIWIPRSSRGMSADNLGMTADSRGLKIQSIETEEFQSKLKCLSQKNLARNTTSSDLAYVIYTSGTTGKPKGVMIEHKAIVNRIQWQNNLYPLRESDRILQKTPYIFDPSVLELFWAGWYGACVVFAPPESHKDIECTIELFHKYSISIALFVPSMFSVFLDRLQSEVKQFSGNQTQIFPALRYLYCGGEVLHLRQVQQCQQLLPHTELHNLYGPTEAAIDVLYYDCTAPDIKEVHIGKPIENTSAYVLDSYLNPLPIGAVGELHIGGENLARGYLNRPELTAEKFIANPFQTETEKLSGKNATIYKTGDLVRWLPDGNIEFIGRTDFQVKIRGFRIELGEIENVLNSFQDNGVAITQSVALVKKRANVDLGTSDDIYLAGYYVSEAKLDEEKIVAYLNTKLPAYMVPAVFVHLTQLPFTANEKLDTKALPEPEFIKQTQHIAPRNKLEEQICQVWADVLGLSAETIGIRDDFFRLGGSSILAIRLVNQLNKALNAHVSVSIIFKHTTIEHLAQYLENNSQAQDDALTISTAVFNSFTEQMLSFAQERLWFIDKFEEGSNAYNIPIILKLANDVQYDLLKTSLQNIVQRHEVLRTLIKEDDQGKTYQFVCDSPCELQKVYVINRTVLTENLGRDFSYIYNLSSEYPIRACVYELKDCDDSQAQTERFMSVVIHHIAFDGWSVDVFLQELQAHYDYNQKKSAGLPSHLDLPDLAIQYKDFAVWQRNYLTGETFKKQLNFWKRKLDGFETLNLTTDKTRPSKINYRGENVYVEFSEELSSSLRNLAKELKVSLYTLLLSGYSLMLRSYSAQSDFVIGTPVSNRHYNQIENLIGFFINSLALRIQINSEDLVSEFIQRLGRETSEAQLHQDLPFEKLVSELNVDQDPSRHPIFQVLFCVQNFGSTLNSKLFSQNNEMLRNIYKIAKFDLSTFIDDSETQLKCIFNYATSLYTESTIRQFSETYVEILKQFSTMNEKNKSKQSIVIADLNYLTSQQYKQVIELWNKTEKAFDEQKTIHGLFEEQVSRTPNNTALIFKNIELTYSQLNERANQLAHFIKDKHETFVVVCLDRSEHMLISILAILKAGGAYVPIDPNYPDKRIQYILENTNTKLILTNEVYKGRLEDMGSTVLAVDNDFFQSQLQQESQLNPNTQMTSSDLAYVIYTSGTTGKPKGVMIEHQGAVNRIQWHNNQYPLHESDRVLQKTPYVFDVSVWELFWAHWYGACIVFLEPDAHKDAKSIIEIIREKSITAAHFVPSMLSVFLDAVQGEYEQGFLDQSNAFSKFKYLFCSGEALNLNQVQQCHELLINTEIHNLYGPTEASVDVLYYDCTNRNIKDVCIGKPIDNTQVYVLNSNRMPLPIGALGELYLGGVGLARGYLNAPALTSEKFVPNPFQTESEKSAGKNTKIYKTGDLVRWRADGNLEYIGRTDFQIKIRGFRIELGEIENALNTFEDNDAKVTQTLVLAKEQIGRNGGASGNKYLVAYYVSKSKFSEDTIVSYLQKKLPEYMIPSAFVHLETMPLTINGKADRKALPDPEFTQQNSYVAPRTDLERQICQIWAEVLGLSEENVGIRDDFFRLGGNSIVSILFVSRLRQKLNLTLGVKDVFNYKTVEKIYDFALSKTLTTTKLNLKTEQGLLVGNVPLLPIQQWFFENQFVKENHWNQSFLVQTPLLDQNRLQSSVDQLIMHHDSFRLRYKKDEFGNSVQYYDPNAPKIKLNVLNISELKHTEGTREFEIELQNILTTWQSDFDLNLGPVACLGYVYGYADSSARIHFACHHLIIDAISWRILVQDLQDLYEKKELGSKGSSYRQWVETVQNYGKTHADEQSYWSHIVSDFNPQPLETLVATENIRQSVLVALNTEETQKLLRNSNPAYHTEINDLLLTALAYALSESTKCSVNHVVLEGHGREELDFEIDITRQMGWFTTMYPVRLEVKETFAESIKFIKETLRQIPNKGVGYGALVGYNPQTLPKILFNYLGQFDRDENHERKNWAIVAENSGVSTHSDNQDLNIINMNGAIFNGALQFTIDSQMSEQNTNAFAQNFCQKLKDIINHTSQLKRSFLTTSDISNIIPGQYLDSIQTQSDVDAVYLANSLQQGFVFHALAQGDVDDAYRVQIVWKYANKLNVQILKKAWQYAQKKYPTLRLRFAWEDKILQIVDSESNLDFRFVDLNQIPKIEQERQIRQILNDDRFLPFDLQKSGLFRVYLIKQCEDQYTCLFTNHHVIMDGWSNPRLLQFIHDTYLKLIAHENINTNVDQSYFAAQKYLQEHQDDHVQYWEEALAKIDARCDLSALLKQKTVRLSEYKHITQPREHVFSLENERYEELKQFAQQYAVTLNAVLQYVWHKVLCIYGGSSQTIVGTTVSGRNLPVDFIEDSVGLYINTLPLIFDHAQSKTVIESLQQIQDSILDLNQKSATSLGQLQKSGTRLFDSVFVYENYPKPVQNDSDSPLKIQFQDSIEKGDYPLSVIAYESNNALTMIIKYAGELFDGDTVESLISVMKLIIQQIIFDPNQQVQNLKCLPIKEYKQVVELWNQTEKAFDDQKTIHGLFEEQVLRTPNNIALIYENFELTYSQLNERANQLAHYIKDKHEKFVVVCLDRSEHMLISILAVLKADAAYVPIDPNYPDDRIQYILADTNTKIILTNEVYKGRLEDIWIPRSSRGMTTDESHVLAVDNDFFQSRLQQESKLNLNTQMTSSHLAYVIYTSGTTGKPKGVMVEHKGTVNRIQWQNNLHPLYESDRILQKTPYVFDPSVLELFWASWYGAAVVFAPPESHKDIDHTLEILEKKSISVVLFVPSMFSVFLDKVHSEIKKLGVRKGSLLPALRYMYCGGEVLHLSQVQQCHDLLPHTGMHNLYGPTEASIDVLYYDCTNRNIKDVYIGKPIDNIQVYVLNPYLNPLPIGAIGELHVGGEGLARGYLNRPELTAEKFIPNPFQTESDKRLGKNAKLYKTGDLVRWLADGNLEYIGRTDFQVKVRGFRIELREIENALNSFNCDGERIVQSAVLVKSHKGVNGASAENKYLVGYYVSECKLNEEKIIAYLQTKLPEHMIPTSFVHLKALPFTVNEKLDVKALPDPELSNESSYVAPRNELEKKICQIWAEVLDLPKETIGVQDEFFKLGGNSILAIRLMSRINKEFEKNINVSVIFREKTVAKIKEILQTTCENEVNSVVITQSNVRRPEDQTLSFAQERLWFIEKYEGGTNVYNIPMVCQLSADVESSLLENSLNDIVSRHEILRTMIREDHEGNTYQFVSDEPLKIERVLIQDQAQLDQMIKKEMDHIYHLSSEYPIRVCLYELGSHEKYMSIVIHHIAFDGWSVDLFFKELETNYDYYQKKSVGLEAHLELPKLPIQYKDFALWQRNYLNDEMLKKQLSFWKNKLDGYETLNLKTDQPRPAHINYKGKDFYFELDAKLSLELRTFAKDLNVSLYSLLLSAYYLMLKSYSYQNDLVIGTPIANRHYHQLENIIGFFVNSLALRVQIDSNASLVDFIKHVGHESVESQGYQDLPFEKLVSELNIEKDTSRHPVFQIVFGVQSFGNSVQSHYFTPLETETQTAKFDITTFIDDSQVQLKGVFNYATHLFHDATIEGYVETYTQILSQFADVAQDSKKKTQFKIAQLNYLTPNQYRQTVEMWNQTEKDYESVKTIHALFEEQVEKTPNSIALVYENTALTYCELNIKANQMAHFLRNTYSIQSDTLITLCLERSELMMIAILAVLKSGGAYVPIDPKSPAERIQYILKDTNSKILFTDEMYRNLQEKFELESKQNLNLPIHINTLAYVIYTSGTTGAPKGVMIEHAGVINNTVFALSDIYDFQKGHKVTAFASYAFDSSIPEFFTPLLRGGELHILSEQMRTDVFKMSAYISQRKINYIYLPSALLAIFPRDHYESLQGIVYAGEPCDPETAHYWSNNYKLYNCYGPTETTVNATKKQVLNGDANLIGSPIANAQCYVLDVNLTPLPIGAVGELYVGGVGLARGYLNRDDLTAERFIPNPFQTVTQKQSGKNAKLYKTGDLVRWLADGNLEYIGRTDFQIKIRGFRIELAEIENALTQYTPPAIVGANIKIQQAIVLPYDNSEARGSSQKYLVGYYVSDTKLDEEKIFTYLHSKLPEYMVPNVLVHLEKMPLTINGKIDRKGLPKPQFVNAERFVAPRNHFEKKLTELYADLLGISADQISVQDDFFRLGGNSILAIRLMSHINRFFKIEMAVSAIFTHKAIEQLVHYALDNQKHSDNSRIIKKIEVNKAEEQLLSFAQERLWFIEKYEEGTNAYNIPIVYKLETHVQFDLLERALHEIVTRHEVLRTYIKDDDFGNTYQSVSNDPIGLKRVQVKTQIQLEEFLQQDITHIFNLSSEYPIRMCVYEFKSNDDAATHSDCYLSIVLHHIAFDGWSTDILLNELAIYYEYYKRKSEGVDAQLNLPVLTIQYKDFALWQRNYLTGEVFNTQLNFWKNKLNGFETLNLITDKSRPSRISYQGANLFFEFDHELSSELRGLAKELKVSLYALLLSGYALMLKSYSNQNDFVIGTPVSNRHYSQVTNLIGFFINSLAIRIQINSKESIYDFIQRIGLETGEAQSYQDLPFEKLVAELNVAQDSSRHPLFQVMFSVQNFGHAGEGLFQNEEVLKNPYTVAKFDISTFIDDSAAQLKGLFNYATSLYTEATISRFMESYVEILKQFTNRKKALVSPDQNQISNIRYLPQKQNAQVIDWNKTAKEYDNQKTMHALFEEQVLRTPNNIAVIYKSIELTYRQLNERSNQLARFIQQSIQTEPDSLVVICLDRSEQMLIAILGVLKSGAAYVPVEPSYPDSRIQCILDETKTKLILTNEIYKARLEKIWIPQSSHEMAVIAVDSVPFQRKLNRKSKLNLRTKTTSAHLAYVIFTSGTTGKPKGVMIEHKGVVNIIQWFNQICPQSDGDKFLQKTPYVFDASVLELFWPIWYGASIVFAPPESHKDVDFIIDFIYKNSISTVFFVPSMLSAFLEQVRIKSVEFGLDHSRIFPSLKYLYCGGETLHLSQVQQCHKLLPHTKMHNVYGPTEASINVLHFDCNDQNLKEIHIGKPLNNTIAYVLDAHLNPLPIGGVGELHVGGEGLARGYLNRPDLTAEKFILNPFQTEIEKCSGKNARLYKTGDLVRWRPDGNVEYIGRNDFQVKIRGFRIELGEIENTLNSFEYNGVRIVQSAVLVKESTHNDIGVASNKYLVSYYVSESKINEEKIIGYLQTKLPEYMVPTVFVHLKQLPFTVNEKLDVRALPNPEFHIQPECIKPRNELEEQICEIWAEVLGVPQAKIGIRDDFFALGGNSILAIRLLTRLNHFYASNLKLTDLFFHRNIQSISIKMLQTRKSYQAISKINKSSQPKNLFMIHPGNAGCEVYVSLAHKLAGEFSCYGVDYYNLYNEDKIDSLHSMAKVYLNHIDAIMKETNQTEYHFLGWSLGGLIALEIAALLEDRGIENIKLYVLDTELRKTPRKISESEIRNHYSSQGFDTNYIDKIISVMDVEVLLLQQETTFQLHASKVLLFKAMLPDPRFQSVDANIQKAVSTNKYNHINKVMKNNSDIKVIKVHSAHHGNIIEKEDILRNGMIAFERSDRLSSLRATMPMQVS